jgi:hypothetical protein
MNKLNPKVEEWLLNPPVGSKAAAAKEFGIDLTLLVRNLRLTPQERAEKLQSVMRFNYEIQKQGKLQREKSGK